MSCLHTHTLRSFSSPTSRGGLPTRKDNAYGAVIFFSRCIGKAEDGSNQYERLITFEPLSELKVEPISRKAEQVIQDMSNG